jgi:hypothetical protein
MEKFIIYKIDNPMLIKCILPVISKNNDTVTLEYTDLDLTPKRITIKYEDGEFYTEEVRLRRAKELSIRNIISIMEYNNVTIEDLQQKVN